MTVSDPTHRDQLLDAAQALVLSKGYTATKVDEVCKAAGVTKGSFYHHFESKEDLAFELVDHYFNALAAGLSGHDWAERDSAVDRVLGFVDAIADAAGSSLLRSGCLLGSFALDLSHTHPRLREVIEAKFAAIVGLLEPHLGNALVERGRQGTLDPGVLACQFLAVLQGAIVVSKARADHSVMVESIRCFRSMLCTTLGVGENGEPI